MRGCIIPITLASIFASYCSLFISRLSKPYPHSWLNVASCVQYKCMFLWCMAITIFLNLLQNKPCFRIKRSGVKVNSNSHKKGIIQQYILE